MERGEVAETDSLEATLPKDDSLPDAYVPVHFQSKLTEWECSSCGVWDHRKTTWKLEFSVREDAE